MTTCTAATAELLPVLPAWMSTSVCAHLAARNSLSDCSSMLTAGMETPPPGALAGWMLWQPRLAPCSRTPLTPQPSHSSPSTVTSHQICHKLDPTHQAPPLAAQNLRQQASQSLRGRLDRSIQTTAAPRQTLSMRTREMRKQQQQQQQPQLQTGSAAAERQGPLAAHRMRQRLSPPRSGTALAA